MIRQHYDDIFSGRLSAPMLGASFSLNKPHHITSHYLMIQLVVNVHPTCVISRQNTNTHKKVRRGSKILCTTIQPLCMCYPETKCVFYDFLKQWFLCCMLCHCVYCILRKRNSIKESIICNEHIYTTNGSTTVELTNAFFSTIYIENSSKWFPL